MKYEINGTKTCSSYQLVVMLQVLNIIFKVQSDSQTIKPIFVGCVHTKVNTICKLQSYMYMYVCTSLWHVYTSPIIPITLMQTAKVVFIHSN